MTSIPAHERLLDLVIALTQARPMMTKSQIRRQVRGYADTDSGAGQRVDRSGRSRRSGQEAFDRKFDRDKETLRQLGIPLLTLRSPVHEDEVGYRIDLDDYELPRVRLTTAELGVLALAAEAWQDSELTRSARRALTKLRARTPEDGPTQPDAGADAGAHPADSVLAGPGLLSAPEAALPDLLAAITDRVAVEFGYHAARTGRTSRRRVEPWRVVARDRGWYLVGWDRDRRDRRTFRLSRIEGAVTPIPGGAPIEIPAEHAGGPEPGADPVLTPVELAVRPDRAPRLRAAGRVTGRVTGADGDQRDLLLLESADLADLAGELAGYGDSVVVLTPPSLREAVLERLRAVAGLDGDHDPGRRP